MTRFHFTNGLLISTLALAAAACSSDATTTSGTGKDGGTGGSTSGGGSTSTGGSTSGGGAKSTGGTTSGGGATSTGGAKSTGGTTSGDAGESDGAIATSATCEGYCTANLAACTGDVNKRYDSKAACLTACAAFPTTGHDGDTAGNTLQCRIYHTSAAANGTDADKKLHCPHTGITPTAFCVNN